MRMFGQDSRFRKAKGISLNKFAVHTGHNKIEFIPRIRNSSHYTLHFGVRPDILDLHETWRDRDGDKHKTLFAMRLSDLPDLLTKLGHGTAKSLSGVFRKLRLGWMGHHKIGLVLGLFPTDQEVETIGKLDKRKRLVLSEQALEANIRIPEFLEDIFNEPDGPFTLISMKRGKAKQIGFGYKVTLPTGEPRLFWVKQSDILAVMHHLENQFVQAVSKYAIPPECYSQYGL